MTYRPEGSVSFSPPLRERLPSLGYLFFALTVSGVIVYGQNAPSGTWLFNYVVEGDRNRLISSSVCAIILFTSALAAVLREQMRGVVVHPDGIETRELLALGWPRVQRFHWSQIDRLVVPPSLGQQSPPATAPDEKKNIRIDLWDGTTTWLPSVSNVLGLALMLEKVALARAIPIEGGTGLLDDLGNPLGDDGGDVGPSGVR
jgi:hypothetical protein